MSRSRSGSLSQRKRKADDDQLGQNKLRKLNSTQKQALHNKNQCNTKKLLDHFQQGDLVFGLSASYRKTITSELEKRGYSYIYANQLNRSYVVRYVLGNADDMKINALTEYQKAHYEFLRKHKAYLTAPGGKPLRDVSTNRKLSVAKRRACKLMACSASENHRIHFELDGINIERTCKPEPTDLGISNSELRAAYRQSKIKENPHLFFYKKGEPVPAPWKIPENAQYFQEYDEYRKTKKSR